jgi:hypothetical protein
MSTGPPVGGADTTVTVTLDFDASQVRLFDSQNARRHAA